MMLNLSFFSLAAVFLVLSGCSEPEIICNESPSKSDARKVVDKCLLGGGICTLALSAPSTEIVGQVGHNYYVECHETVRLVDVWDSEDRIEYLYRCSGQTYDAELRVTGLREASNSFGCWLAHINFFPPSAEVPLGDATQKVIILERY